MPACHTPLPPSDSFCTPLLPVFHYLGPGILPISCWTQWNVFGQVPPPHSNLCGVAPNSCWSCGDPSHKRGVDARFYKASNQRAIQASENMLKLRDLQPTNLNTQRKNLKIIFLLCAQVGSTLNPSFSSGHINAPLSTVGSGPCANANPIPEESQIPPKEQLSQLKLRRRHGSYKL